MSSFIGRNVTDPVLSGVGRIPGRRALVIGGALLAAAAAAWRWWPAEAARPPAGPGAGRGAPVAVATAEIARADFPVTFAGLGTVTDSATSIVKPQVSGPLTEVKFREGQAVKAGDVLAQIDPRPFELALAQAEGQLQRDRALLENAERDLARYDALRRKIKNAVSGQQIDTQRALIGQYRASVEIDRALVGQARLNLGYTHIAAPIDGRIGLRLVDPGNIVQTADSNGIAVVTKLTPITVIFSLPEVKLQSVLKRYHSGEKLAVVAYDHEHSAELARGFLYAIDNQIDASSGTVRLRAEFRNEDEKLYPNQFVNAELLVETLHGVTVAPAAAIQRGANGPFVYVVDGEDKVAVKPVRLGPADGERMVIEDGLQPGARVVVEGVDKLRDGAKVILARAGGGPRPEAGSGDAKGGAPAGERRGPPGEGRKRGGKPGE